MFSREARPGRIETLIARAVRVHGDVEFEGGLHLDGRITGDVRSDQAPTTTLSVSETGTIEGMVDVPNVTLAGSIKGDIHARGKVVLAATARVDGNVLYGSIEMTLGARITGTLTRMPPAAEEAQA